MKYGIVTADFSREYVSSNTLYNVNHYKGQVLLSDGENSKCLDDFSIEAIQSNDAALNLIIQHFQEENLLHESSAVKILAVGGSYTSDNLSWMVNQGHYPITWFECFEDALRVYKKAPTNRSIAKSSPVNIQ